MNKQSIPRILFYIAGLLILALGIILNTKCGLGVSPIISVAFSISAITHCSFGNMTFLLYAIFVLAELLIHPDIKPSVPRSSRPRSGHSPQFQAASRHGFAAIAAEFGIYPIYESVFRVDSCTGEIWLSASYSGGRYHLYRHRRRHVAQHAHYPEPGRRHRTGNFGFYRQIRRLHKKLL